jgi:precorrin-6A/cobalt-precorrin-6A reductase
MTPVLVLGGTAEAVTIARRLAALPGLSVTYSLAGRTRRPSLPDCAVRQGGFGGADGLARHIAEHGIAALVDATHPYAERMAANARAAAAQTGVKLFKYLRPAWDEPAGAGWLHVPDADAAARLVEGRFRRVFLSSGLRDVAAFEDVGDCWFLIRSVEAPAAPPLRHCQCIAGRGPFDPAREAALLRDHAIDALVTKNSGGAATASKLQAAAGLGITVVMIDRPPPPDCAIDIFDTTAALIDAERSLFNDPLTISDNTV